MRKNSLQMNKAHEPDIRIGISGWTYGPWRNGAFFPEKWPHKRELEYASRKVNSIEINGTFYSLQKPASFERWRNETRDGFVFSVKGPRFITHIKRLKDVETPLANFYASGVLALGEKLGPFLWQLPPSFHYNQQILRDFINLLPRDLSQASALSRKHDHRVDGRLLTETKAVGQLRHAFEVRHESFCDEEFIRLLRESDVGLVIADTAGKWPFIEDVTSDFVYIRLHGDEEIYSSGYTDEALDEWARKIKAWAAGKRPSRDKRVSPENPPHASNRDIYVYFDNDVKVRAPYDAQSLAAKLKLRMNEDAPRLSRAA